MVNVSNKSAALSAVKNEFDGNDVGCLSRSVGVARCKRKIAGGRPGGAAASSGDASIELGITAGGEMGDSAASTRDLLRPG